MTKRRPVWGYFALTLISLGLAVFLLTLSTVDRIPVQTKLRKISGAVNAITVVDDLSDRLTPLPAFNAIHFTLVGGETMFRYPNHWPGYNELYYHLAFEVDIWVDPQDLGSDEPVVIFRLEQTVPASWSEPPISISYQAIVASEASRQRSFFKGGLGFMGVALVFWVVGVVVFCYESARSVTPKR